MIGTLITEAGSGLDLVARLATVTVLFLLFIYALVIVSALKLRGQDEDEGTYRANTPLLFVGLAGNLAILAWSVYDDPWSLLWCAGLVARRRRAVPARVLLRPAGPARGLRAGRPELVVGSVSFLRRFAPGSGCFRRVALAIGGCLRDGEPRGLPALRSLAHGCQTQPRLAGRSALRLRSAVGVGAAWLAGRAEVSSPPRP